jgi:hypothetical protein
MTIRYACGRYTVAFHARARPAALAVVLAAGGPVRDLSARYLDSLFSALHLSHVQGVHREDRRLMALDPPRSASGQELRSWRRVRALDAASCGRSSRCTDPRGRNRAQALLSQDLREWTWDPRLYDSFRSRPRGTSPPPGRAHPGIRPRASGRSVTAELAAPHHLAVMQASLVAPPGTGLAQAVKDNAGGSPSSTPSSRHSPSTREAGRLASPGASLPRPLPSRREPDGPPRRRGCARAAAHVHSA